MIFRLLLLLFVAGQLPGLAQRLVSTVVRLGDVAFYMHSTPLSGPALLENSQIAEPCTLLTVEHSIPTWEHIQQTLHDFGSVDDVWSPEFMHSVVIQTTLPESSIALIDELKHNLFDTTRVESIYVIRAPNGSAFLPQGPYFLQSGRFHHAYRLYPDTNGAFVVAAVSAGDNGTFRALDAAAYGEEHPSALTVAVPSRLYFTKTKDKPYNGLRLAVKDIMDLKGLKTGASSRAYTALHAPRTASAEIIQRLVDLGAVVVGKTKTTQFADSEWPTCDWVDYHAPFNPRGDGYLTTSGSSAGSAAAVAAYGWLDFTLGTDTLGSIRAPAAAQGIFGMRPSLGAASFSGVLPYSPKFDTIGGFARSADGLRVLAEALYGSPADVDVLYSKKPTRILYPTEYWPVEDSQSQEVFGTFISRLEGHLGVERTEISLEVLWEQHRPDDITESLSEYFEHIFEWAANPDQWTGLFRDFLLEYEGQFGKLPELNPQVRFKVEYLPSVVSEQQAEAVRRLKIYQDWFYGHVMPPADEDGYSSTVMVLPWTTGEPDYRDKYRDGPQRFTGVGFFFYNVGPYAEAPELIIPVGSTPYISKVTSRREKLPAAVGLVGAKGSDIALARLVSELLKEENGSGAATVITAAQKPLNYDEL